MKSAQRASSVTEERPGNTQLIEARQDSSRSEPSTTFPAQAPEAPGLVLDLQLRSKEEAPLLQILPYFEIKRSDKGGYGAFALEDLPPQTNILSETALIEAANYNLLEKFELLSAVEKEKFMDLASFDKISSNKIVTIFKTNRSVELTCSET
jgi:hypothetical protein